MPSINERYPKRGFLTAKDVEDGDLTLRIASVAWDENIGNGKTKDVVRFFEDGRELALNAINARRIAKLHGDEANNWRGCWITLYLDPDVEYQGQKQPGIRVREQMPARDNSPAPISQPVRQSPSQDMDDEIPF
jgi:hypothetical protein